MNLNKVRLEDDAEIIKNFKAIGFTEYEAKVYMQLMRSGTATAYEIAKESGVPRPNTYNALEALTKRGSVLPVNENPRRYVAKDPASHLTGIGRDMMTLCVSLTEKLREIEEPDDAPYVWNVHGEAAMHEKIDALIEGCNTTLWAKASSEVLERHSEALKAAAERDVEMLIVIYGEDADAFRFTEKCRIYLHESNGTRMGTADNLFTMTIDHKQALTATTDGPVAFYTHNQAMVTMADSLIRHDYYMAEILDRFGTEVFDAFGPYLKDLRMNVFTKAQASAFQDRTGLDVSIDRKGVPA